MSSNQIYFQIKIQNISKTIYNYFTRKNNGSANYYKKALLGWPWEEKKYMRKMNFSWKKPPNLFCSWYFFSTSDHSILYLAFTYLQQRPSNYWACTFLVKITITRKFNFLSDRSLTINGLILTTFIWAGRQCIIFNYLEFEGNVSELHEWVKREQNILTKFTLTTSSS